ncbi:hypothetical protein REPUB_Repub16aG0036200 [Reevesia pubescens]
MEEWSPQDAMKAYLHTLNLNKVESKEDEKPRVIEPKCTELISALAAGKGAKLIVEITTQGITPLTMALGVAAKQTGGQLICIVASESDQSYYSIKSKADDRHVETDGLGDVVKLVHAGSPCEMMMQMQLKNIDFAVIDCNFNDSYLKLMFKKLDANIVPTGSTVIVHNLQHTKAGSVSFAEVVKRRGVESVTLPIGEGIELTKILGSTINIRRDKRFHVTFDD